MTKIKILEKLTTKRLLAYYRSQRKARTMLPYTALLPYSDEEEKEWDDHLKEVKKMLDEREHIESDFICGGKETTYNNLIRRVKEIK